MSKSTIKRRNSKTKEVVEEFERKIYIIGGIDEEMYERVTQELAYFENISSAPIDIELSSYGGAAYDALALYDRIKSSECAIHIRATGLIASAAVLVLAAGSHRFMTPSSWLMVHEDSMAVKKSSFVSELLVNATHLAAMEDQWAELLAQRSNLTAKQWRQYHKDTTFFNAEQCVEAGIIEGIWE